MKILFTTSNSLLSRMIRRATREDCSHCAIEMAGLVFHSNLLGVHVDNLETFLTHSRIVHSVEIQSKDGWARRVIEQHKDAGYDFGALLYLGIRFVLPWLPAKNLWQTTGMFLCTEWVTEVLDGAEDHEITPYQLYLRLSIVELPVV